MDAGAARLRPGSIGVGVESPGAGFFGGAAGNAQGSSLAVGNFDGSGLAEVGVGVTGYTDSADTQGSVWIWSLDPPGLPGFFYQGQAGGLDSAEPFDRFGEVLAVGDFDGDGRDDLAIGVPGENFGDGGPSPRLDAGVVQVVYGSTLGASLAGNQLWSLDTPGIGAFNAASNDRFGDALATGDFDGDGADDLAIGIPGADVGANGSGAVQILYGNVRSLFSDGFESGDVSAWSESLSLSASHTASSASVWGPSPAAP
jgi:hypothetical protein